MVNEAGFPRKLWYDFRAIHNDKCEFGEGHTVTLGAMAYSTAEALRDVRFRWGPTFIIDPAPKTNGIW